VGMGKTIMLSALLQTSLPTKDEEQHNQARAKQLRLNAAFRPIEQRKSQDQVPSATLIVAPTSLLHQWAEELQRSSKPGTVLTQVWHGQNRTDLEDFLDADDEDSETRPTRVVITSYGVLASEHAKMEKTRNAKSPIFSSN